MLSCDNKKKATESSILVYRSNGFDFNKKRKYTLKIFKKDSLKTFDYVFKTNNEFNIRIQLYEVNDSLSFLFDKYEKVEKESFSIKSLSEYPFSVYKNLSMDSHNTEPIIINKNYGLLAIGNVMAPNFIFLKKEKDTIHFDVIKEKILQFY